MRPRLYLEIDAGALRGELRARGAAAWRTSIPYMSTDELRVAIGSLRRTMEDHRAAGEVEVTLAPGVLQSRHLEGLPAVAVRELGALVARSPARYFRQNGHSLITAARWVPAASGPRGIARAVATEEALVAAVLAGAAEAGVRVTDITPSHRGEGLSLLPEGEVRRRQAARWRQTARLGAAVVALWLVAAGIHVALLARRTMAVEAELARLAGPRDALVRARRSLDSATAMVGALEESARVRRQLAQQLAALATRLPDSALLHRLTLNRDGQVEVIGRAAHAGAVAQALREAPPLPRLEFMPEVAREAGLGVEWEPFTLRSPGRRAP